ncbi:MAG: nucleotidyl transferase AbiEii/AbiGii toxin family protein [Cuniculiplasma sp.]
MNIDPVNRERKVLNLLDEWPWEIGGVLIGGYAIAAYGKPRYSNDVDIVIPSAALGKLEIFIYGQNFELENSSVPTPQNYEGKVLRYRTAETTLDVLAGYVRDREARVDIPEPWISKDHRNLRLITLTGGTRIKIPIASPEALWALKLQSGRDQDIIDLFSMFDVKIDGKKIIDLFNDLKSNTLIHKLKKTLQKTHSNKLYEDSMSRLETKRTDKNKKNWISFGNQVNHIVSETMK